MKEKKNIGLEINRNKSIDLNKYMIKQDYS